MLLVIALQFACAPSFGKGKIAIDKDSHHFIDDDGNIRIFHGVNVVVKQSPYIPELETFNSSTSVSNEDLTNLKNWGFNVIRLGVMWPGVQPISSNINDVNYTYLEKIGNLIAKMYNSYDIYTIIDFHQDLLTPYYCGEGIPDWLFKEINVTLHLKQNEHMLKCQNFSQYALNSNLEKYCKTFSSFNISNSASNTSNNGHANITQCRMYRWFPFYETTNIAALFEIFYTNETFIDYYINYWQIVIEYLKKNINMDAILGYDLFNEPFSGDIWHNKKDIISPTIKYTDKVYLSNIYNKLTNLIRTNNIDNDTIFFYESSLIPINYQIPLTNMTYDESYSIGLMIDNLMYLTILITIKRFRFTIIVQFEVPMVMNQMFILTM